MDAFSEILSDMKSTGATYLPHRMKQKAPDAVSWYRPHLEMSLALIEKAAPCCSASIIDVGGGESTLVDDLLARGYENM